MILHYFVEGENERKLIETIKNKYLYSGKIKIINTIQNKVPNSILRTLERETVVVLVFDTDVEKIDSTNINKIVDLLESKSKTNFKNDFNNCKNLMKKLEDKEFKISKLWSRNAVDIYKKYKNDSEVIKKKV